MASGVDDLLWILGGTAVQAVSGTKRMIADSKQNGKIEFIKQYIKENTDEQLEAQIENDIWDPAKYDEIWERIERYHRDNPVNGWRKLYKDTSRVVTVNIPNPFGFHFSIDDIGQRRLPFLSEAKTKSARKGEMEAFLYDCQEVAIALTMWIYGKESSICARENAKILCGW